MGDLLDAMLMKGQRAVCDKNHAAPQYGGLLSREMLLDRQKHALISSQSLNE